MIDTKIIKSVFNQCKNALSIPHRVSLQFDGTGMTDISDDDDYGMVTMDEIHGSFTIYINPNVHSEDNIYQLKNTCLHELIHTYFFYTRNAALVGCTNKEQLMIQNLHERDVSTMATCLCRTIKVKEEEIKFKTLDKV